MAINKTRSDYINHIQTVLMKSQNGIEPAEINASLDEAVIDIYSPISPKKSYWKIEDDDVDGTIQAWEVPDEWEDNFSYIESVEYPVDEDPPEFLESEEFNIYYDAEEEAWKFRMFEDTPDDTVLVIYYVRHTLTDALNTIPDSHFYAVCNIAAEKLCRLLATQHAQDSAPTISADSSNRSSISGNFLRMAESFKKEWRAFFGITDQSQTPAALVFSDMDLRSGIDNGDLMFHGRKLR